LMILIARRALETVLNHECGASLQSCERHTHPAD
jgi:hypothetical protein